MKTNKEIIYIQYTIYYNIYMKKILFVLDYYLPHRWGVENVFENIISRLEKKWYKIIILTSRFDKNLKKTEINWNITIYRCWTSRKNFIRYSIFKGNKILKENSDIKTIHASTYWWAIPWSILWIIRRKKVILTIHEIFNKLRYEYKGFWKWLIYKIFEQIIFLLKYDIYHCVSNNTAKDIKKTYKIKQTKIKVIHNWVDTEFRNPNKVNNNEITNRREKYNWWNKNILLYFWHAGKSKGIDYLIQALPEIVKIKDNLMVFNLIESERTQKSINKIKKVQKIYPNKIQIFNWLPKDNLRILIASINCVIAPSLSEWFGSVHTETCAMNKALITTKTSAIPEVVRWKVKFIHPRNSQEIINAIKSVKKQERENIKEKEFNRDKTVKEIEELYK